MLVWKLRYFFESFVTFEKLFYTEKLRCIWKLRFSGETVLLWKTALLENCVTWNCVTIWETALLEKLCYLKLRYYLRNFVTWKTVLLENCVTLKICVTVVKLRCFENYVTLKILRWGALLFWKVTYLKNICVTL